MLRYVNDAGDDEFLRQMKCATNTGTWMMVRERGIKIKNQRSTLSVLFGYCSLQYSENSAKVSHVTMINNMNQRSIQVSENNQTDAVYANKTLHCQGNKPVVDQSTYRMPSFRSGSGASRRQHVHHRGRWSKRGDSRRH